MQDVTYINSNQPPHKKQEASDPSLLLLDIQMRWMWTECGHDWRTSNQTLWQQKLNGGRIVNDGIRVNEEEVSHQ